MQKIKDYKVYVERMEKSIQDKLFFVDKVINDVKGVVDYGCADGTLLACLHEMNPELELTGCDIDKDMIELAKAKVENAEFTTEADSVGFLTETEHCLLNLSSVIHEVYSYCNHKQIKKFWEFVFNSRFKYIAIRDMCVNMHDYKLANTEDVRKVLNKANEKQLMEFEKTWGMVGRLKNLIHFLLKYKYVENWDREVKEDYLPLSFNELMSKIPTDMYDIVYLDHFTLPYIAEQVKKDFDIDLRDATHVKILLRRKGGTK